MTTREHTHRDAEAREKADGDGDFMDLMDDDAFVRDMGALDRVRDHIRERNTRYAKWRRQQARAADAAAETAGAGAGHE